jgi:tetratricopeptide (TPR) repeat protein
MRNAGQFALPLLLVLVGLPLSAQVQIPPELENEKPLANESAGNTAQRVQRENMEALKALRLITEQASDPDKVIQLAADFEKNFPKHHLLKSEVRTRASSAYFSKGDVASAVEAAKRSLEVVDCNIDSLLWSATLLSQEAVVAAAGPAPYARLNAASDYAKKSLDVMAIVRSNRQKTGTTQSSATDPKLRWTTREDLHNLVLRNAKDEVFEYWMKRDTAIARNVLGMVHAMQAERAQGDARTTELDRAAQELTAAASAAPSAPEYQMNLGNVYAMRGKDDDAIAAYSKVVKLPARHCKPRRNDGLTSLRNGKRTWQQVHCRPSFRPPATATLPCCLPLLTACHSLGSLKSFRTSTGTWNCLTRHALLTRNTRVGRGKRKFTSW